MVQMRSVFWAIAILLFLGGLGIPVPENPALMGGGYALHKHLSPPLASLFVWYLAIMLGDSLLFASSYWIFTRPRPSELLERYVGRKKLEEYRTTFAGRAGWTLFLARFTFGIRALVYLAAGAARYPWQRFLAIDGVSVALQVLLFVGIGFYAGERTKWAQSTGEKIALLLGIFALAGIFVSYFSSAILQKLSMGKKRENNEAS
ncbi:MAG: VTT domain-containing protein [Syntrophobacterales bacterium]|jgi:membrane-associated protein